jgi:predicted MPP superfamily phosphohydrolase
MSSWVRWFHDIEFEFRKTCVRGASSSRRRFLKVASGAATVSALAVTADATFIEPNRPRLLHQEILLRRLPHAFDGFTIVQLSDFHYDPYFSATPIATAVRMTNELKPDLVVLTGDFVSAPAVHRSALIRRAAAHMEPCAEVLRELRAPYGVWAVLGNHDVFSDPHHVQAALRRSGIQILRNEAVPIERDGQKFWLAGLGDVLAGDSDLEGTLRAVSPMDAVVLLAHEPDFADYAARYPVDLQLSGHSHGGQVRFPFVGPIYLPPLAQKYPQGLRQVGRLMLYTNVGIGTLLVPVRWNCPPEVTLITLRALRARS